MTAELVAKVAYRLTGRDREPLALVWEHRVLTTGQLTATIDQSTTLRLPKITSAQVRLHSRTR